MFLLSQCKYFIADLTVDSSYKYLSYLIKVRKAENSFISFILEIHEAKAIM